MQKMIIDLVVNNFLINKKVNIDAYCSLVRGKPYEKEEKDGPI